jgi:hypothetical protein
LLQLRSQIVGRQRDFLGRDVVAVDLGYNLVLLSCAWATPANAINATAASVCFSLLFIILPKRQ